MPSSDVYVWAMDGFDRFTSVWQFEDFWTRSNTFEACLRFVTAAQAKWPADPEVEAMETFLRQEMIPANQIYFTFYLSQAMWADDYGWCGIASLTARDYLLRVGDAPGAAAYLAIAQLCWKKMVTSGYDSSAAAQPVPHGCGNGNGTDPGTKNTVTNANLFVLSVRLYEILGATAYLQMSYQQYLWFSSWSSLSTDTCEQSASAPGSSRSGRSRSRTTRRRTARRGSPAGSGRATRAWSSERSRASWRSRTP